MMPLINQVWLVLEPTDMRQGMDVLSQLIQNSLGHSPCEGSAYAFRNRKATRLKLLVWDGTGVWLFQRRLYKGKFIWPQVGSKTCILNARQWSWLITGVDWYRLEAVANAKHIC